VTLQPADEGVRATQVVVARCLLVACSRARSRASTRSVVNNGGRGRPPLQPV